MSSAAWAHAMLTEKGFCMLAGAKQLEALGAIKDPLDKRNTLPAGKYYGHLWSIKKAVFTTHCMYRYNQQPSKR